MTALFASSIAGIFAGGILLRKLPTVPDPPAGADRLPSVSVIIPARNEAHNLPDLLESLPRSGVCPLEILVVDDGSDDGTASIAEEYGSVVISSKPLPDGWTGKTWALHQGALAATGGVFFFLDADTRFAKGGYPRAVRAFAECESKTAMSILPFHSMQKAYEQLSLFFNLMVAAGAGGFSGLARPRLFGPSLLIAKDLYWSSGGHEAVANRILENFHLAPRVDAAGGTLRTFVGRGVLTTRMFPEGFPQLLESWRKAFADGAGSTSLPVLLLTIVWLGSACSAFLLLALHPTHAPLAVLALYGLFAAEVAVLSRKLGNFHGLTATLFPIPLCFYFVVFAQSLLLHVSRRPVPWRGRQV